MGMVYKPDEHRILERFDAWTLGGLAFKKYDWHDYDGTCEVFIHNSAIVEVTSSDNDYTPYKMMYDISKYDDVYSARDLEEEGVTWFRNEEDALLVAERLRQKSIKELEEEILTVRAIKVSIVDRR